MDLGGFRRRSLTFGRRSQELLLPRETRADITHVIDKHLGERGNRGGAGPIARHDHIWKLEGPDGEQASIHHRPRLVSDDMIALRNAAIAGVGVVHLPLLMVSDEIRNGHLVRLLPSWAPRRYVVHAVYPSKRGLLPSVRVLLDYLGARFSELSED